MTDGIPFPDAAALAGLFAKMVATALFVIVIAQISEKAGPFFAAMLASLPIYSGPIYLFLALEHTPEYLAQAAVGSTAISATIPVFSLTYCALAMRHGMGLSLSGALLAWILAALAVRSHAWTIGQAVLLWLTANAIAVPLSRRFTRAASVPRAPRNWIDLPLRASLVALLVGVVTALSSHVPPMLTGILSVMPVIFTSLILVLHPRIGGPATAVLLAHSIGGMIGMTIGFVVVHLTIVRIGTVPALLIGLSISVAWNLMLIFARHGVAWIKRRG